MSDEPAFYLGARVRSTAFILELGLFFIFHFFYAHYNMSVVNVVNASAARWSVNETNYLLNLWGTDDVQDQLDGTVRDAEVYRQLTIKMQEAGYNRSANQVKTRLKILKRTYRAEKSKNNSTTNILKQFRFYKQIDRVLGDGTASPPPLVVSENAAQALPIKIECVEEPEVRMDVTPCQPPSTTLLTESPSVKMDPVPIIQHVTGACEVYDLCIVGAGMFGSAAARHASANVGVKICLIGPDEPSPKEMPNQEIFGSYYDESRIVTTLECDYSTSVLSKNSIKRYRELEKLSGIDFYYPVGCLHVSKINSPLLKKTMQNSQNLDIPVVDLSYNDIFERRFPYIKLKGDDHPILDDCGAGYINPRNMVSAQKNVAKNQGCDLIDDVVHEVKPLVNGIHEIITENKGMIKAKRVLICTGAFTNFKNFPMPKLQFVINKESAALLKVSFKEARRLSAMPSIVYSHPEDKFGAYILPPILYPDGYRYLKIGHIDFENKDSHMTSLEEVKNWYLSKGDTEKINSLSKFLIDMLPGLKYEEITEMTSVTSHNSSGLPYIDRVSATVTVCAVGNGTAAEFSDEVGRISAKLSLTGQWDYDLSKSQFQVVYQN